MRLANSCSERLQSEQINIYKSIYTMYILFSVSPIPGFVWKQLLEMQVRNIRTVLNMFVGDSILGAVNIAEIICWTIARPSDFLYCPTIMYGLPNKYV